MTITMHHDKTYTIDELRTLLTTLDGQPQGSPEAVRPAHVRSSLHPGDVVRLAAVDTAHNLRKTFTYRSHAVSFTHTKGSLKVTLGERRKPEPDGRPGYLRVDSVHPGDEVNGEKGVYHINFVDEVSQYEFVACVATIGERDMLPALENILTAFPFVIHEFHTAVLSVRPSATEHSSGGVSLGVEILDRL